MSRAIRRGPKLTVIEGAGSVVVPMTSQGILDFASSLHAIATRMDREVSTSQVFGQSFLGNWQTFRGGRPWSDGPPPTGLVNLVNEIRGPLHVINPTADFERLNRFNARLQALWDTGKAQGQSWAEPRPSDVEPGKGGGTVDDALMLLLIIGAVIVLSRR